MLKKKKRIISLIIATALIITCDVARPYTENADAAEEDISAVASRDTTTASISFIDKDANIYSGDVSMITGEGSYNVTFSAPFLENDFANGIGSLIIQIQDGETLFPGYILQVNSIEINGASASITKKGVTYGSAGMTCLDLYNPLHTETDIMYSEAARTADKSFDGASPWLIPEEYLTQEITTLSINFSYIKPAAKPALTPLPAGSDNFSKITTQPVVKYTFDNSEGIELYGDATISDGVLDLPPRTGGIILGSGTHTSTYAEIADLTDTDFSAGITFTADIYVTGDVNGVPVFSFADSDKNQIYSLANDFKSINYSGPAENDTALIASPYTADWYSQKKNRNKWDTITVTITDSETIIYFDGIEISKSGSSTSLKDYMAMASKNYLGKFTSTDDNVFEGRMDNVAIYNSALTASDVLELSKANGTYGQNLYDDLEVTVNNNLYKVYDGDTVTLAVSAKGGASEDYTYQWYYTDLPGGTKTSISSSTTKELVLPASTDMNNKTYFCEVTSGDDTKSSEGISVSVGSYIYYDANGGTGAPDTQKKEYDRPVGLSTKVPTYEGYDFAGWALKDNIKKIEYQPGYYFSLNDTVTLCAVWTKKATPAPTVTPTPTPKVTPSPTPVPPTPTPTPVPPTPTPVLPSPTPVLPQSGEISIMPAVTIKPTVKPVSTFTPSYYYDDYTAPSSSKTKKENIKCKKAKYTTVKKNGWQRAAIKLTWNKCDKVSKYEIYRSKSKSSGYKKIGKCKPGISGYTDKSVVKGDTYYYKIRACGGPSDGYSDAKKVKVSSKLKDPSVQYSLSSNNILTINMTRLEGDQYQLQYNVKNGGWKTAKTDKIESKVKVRLKSTKGVQLRVRSIMKVKGKTVYSKWSAAANLS